MALRPREGGGLRSWAVAVGPRWGVLAIALVGWQFGIRLISEGKRGFFPPPTEIAQRMFHLWFTGPADHLFLTEAATGNIIPSVLRLLGGWAAAVVVGVSVGLLLGRLRWALDFVEPVIHFLRALPPPALVPIFIVLFKLTSTMRITVIAFGVVWPVILNTVEGARSVDPVQMDTARVFKLTAVERVRRIIIPASLPKIFAGLRISISMALILMVVSEAIGGLNGIGYKLDAAKQAFELPDMWSWLVLIGLLGYCLNAALLWVERRTLAWHRGVRGLE